MTKTCLTLYHLPLYQGLCLSHNKTIYWNIIGNLGSSKRQTLMLANTSKAIRVLLYATVDFMNVKLFTEAIWTIIQHKQTLIRSGGKTFGSIWTSLWRHQGEQMTKTLMDQRHVNNTNIWEIIKIAQPLPWHYQLKMNSYQDTEQQSFSKPGVVSIFNYLVFT